MVHLNGRALPEAKMEQDHRNPILSSSFDRQRGEGDTIVQSASVTPSALVASTASASASASASVSSRRARSRHATRGPKPLLPRSLKEALQLAELLSRSKLIPKGFDTPETCLVGILYGMEVGLSPIAALQRMAVIDGRPTIWGDAALALVQASGLLHSIKEEVIEETKAYADAVTACVGGSAGPASPSNTTPRPSLMAICKVRREGRSEPVIGSFSIEDAKRAGLWQKPGPWTDYPTRMLTMRARAFALRDAFPDVLAGLYIREEFVGKERQASTAERNVIADDAEWIAAATNGTNGATRNNAEAQADVQYHTAIKAPAREQPITSGYDLTPHTHGQTSRADQVHGRTLLNEYDFTPNTHERSDPHDMHDSSSPVSSSQGPRRAPPPPPPPSAPSPTEEAEKASGTEAPVSVSANALTDQDILTSRPSIPAVVSEYDGEIISASDETLDPETLLDLLDSALCCALDLPTFHEIEDDFEERLKSLSKHHRKRAQKIIYRHHKRVEGLDRSSQETDENKNADDMITPKLPPRIETALSHLGIRHRRNRDRRSGRKERPSQSLSSWNARYRVADLSTNTVKANTANEIAESSDHDEEAEARE